MKTVSVVTRTKDRPVFLGRAIESVAGQTYKDYVHVIVNDGGNKGEIESLIAELPSSVKGNIKLFHRDVASNAPDTIFNESIDRVDSRYFAIHDDDDTWHSEFLERTVKHLESHQDLGAVVVRADRIDEELRSDGRIRHIKSSRWMPDVKVINLYRQCIDNQLTPITTLFRRSAYEDVGKFDDTLPVVGDWEFGVRLLQKYDVDFIDPGFSLASYHHRRAKRGAGDINSVSSNDKHRYYTNKVMNRYLRDELRGGHLGVGYFMSGLKYNQHSINTVIKRVLPSFILKIVKRRL